MTKLEKLQILSVQLQTDTKNFAEDYQGEFQWESYIKELNRISEKISECSSLAGEIKVEFFAQRLKEIMK